MPACTAGVHGRDVRPLGTERRVLEWLRAEALCDPAHLLWSPAEGAGVRVSGHLRSRVHRTEGGHGRRGGLRGCVREGAGFLNEALRVGRPSREQGR